MLAYISLWAFLYAFWLLLSGHYTPMLMTLGAISCTLVVYLSHRMDVIDHEGHPSHLSLKILPYWAWLCWQIVVANFAVAKIIISPKPKISPVMFKVKALQERELGQVIYANSITLTPGTVSVGLNDGILEVHALTAEGAQSEIDGEMNKKICVVKGEMGGK